MMWHVFVVFIFIAVYIPFYKYILQFIIYSPVDRYLDCFQVLAIINEAAYMCLLVDIYTLGIYLGMKLMSYD